MDLHEYRAILDRLEAEPASGRLADDPAFWARKAERELRMAAWSTHARSEADALAGRALVLVALLLGHHREHEGVRL